MKRWELPALALLAPLFVFPPVGRPILTLVLLLPCVWIFHPPPRTALNGSLGLFLVAVLVSLTASFDVLFSAPKVLGVVFGIAVFFALVRAIRGPEALALDLFAAAGAALALIGLLGTKWIDKVSLLRAVTSHIPALIRGVPGQAEGFQPNAIAGVLVMFLPLQFALCIAAPARRTLHAACFAITFVTLLLTQSRGGYLSLIAGVIAWLLWSGRRTRRWTLAFLVAAALIAVPLRTRIAPMLTEHVGSGIASDVPSRIELWSRALRAIGDFPLTGLGMNSFRRVMPAMYPVYLIPPEIDIAHAHNHLLQAALDLGLPGLVAYLALWLGAAALLVRAYRRSSKLLVGGLAAGMVAYFAFGTADAIALGAKVGIFFWIALALIVSMSEEPPA